MRDQKEKAAGKPLRALIVEDRENDTLLLAGALRRAGYALEFERVQTAAAMRAALSGGSWDIVLSDHDMPGFSSLGALKVLQETGTDLPFIIVSGSIADEAAVDAMRMGAHDYVMKGNLARLLPAIERELKEAVNRRERRRAEVALEEQRKFLRTIIDTAPNPIFVRDRDGKFTLANKSAAQIYGVTPDDLAGRTDADFNPRREEVELFLRDDREVMATGKPKFVPEEPSTDPATGEVHWFQAIKVPLVASDGTITQVLGVATDITERKNQEEKLARLSRVRAVLSGINAAIVRIRDRQKLFEEACRIAVEEGRFHMAWVGLSMPGMKKVKPAAWSGFDQGYLDEVGSQLDGVSEDHGCGGEVLREKKPVIVNDLESDPRVVFKKEALKRGYRALAVFPLLVGGEAIGIFVLHAAQAGFFDRDEVVLLTEMAGDISFALDYMAKAEEINYLAYYDVMTGLANRSLFHERLSQTVSLAGQERARTAVVVIDIDRFRFINHTLGRHGGDSVLKFVAERLKDSVEVHERLGRVGADTFAMALPKIRGEADIAAFLAGRLIPALSKPLQVRGQELRISVKAGVALCPDDGADADTLLKNAEAALEKAKSAGESYLYYAPQMNERVAEKLTLETRLHKALENEQLVLHYQPKIDLATSSVVGFEALLRWNDPESGLVPPVRFIPLLEETGMILDAGRWIVRQALSDHARWRAQGLAPPPISVNVSPIQLRQKNFVAIVRDAVGDRAAGSPGLEIEITESVIMEDIQANIAKLQAIRDMGIRIAVDDFGTGYSSLSYLAKLPLNALKIDRSFIIELTGSPDDMSIVSTIISLAHALKLEVVAEGVETEEQKNILRLLKCDLAQGYLFYKPLPAESISELLRRLRPQ